MSSSRYAKIAGLTAWKYRQNSSLLARIMYVTDLCHHRLTDRLI
jgi:hypothetical protein